MVAEATFLRERRTNKKTAVAAIVANEVHQLASGEAGVKTGLYPAAIGDATNWEVEGKFTCAKTTGMNFLAGGRAYWDVSASKVHYKKVNDRDFYMGRFVEDAALNDTTCIVDINLDPGYDIDANRDAFLSVPTGTQAVGGFGFPKRLGGSILLELTATSEAQAIDLLSVDRFDKGANAIIEAIVRIPVNGSGAAVDFNVGIANGSSTTDADAITEYLLFHIDGGALDILAQSKDGTTTVAATDTTIDATAGSAVANRVEFWLDTRSPEDCQLYVNGVLVLTATVFKIDAATGPFGLLMHLEKTTGTTTGQFVLDTFRARFAEQ